MEAEGNHRNRLINTPDRITERPPRGGLSVWADHIAVRLVANGTSRHFAAPQIFGSYWGNNGHAERVLANLKI
jgi:hypothetical protein